MKRRVARLLEEGQNPRRVLAVTFTRNAASELVSDLHELGVDGCKEVRTSTLHSFCFAVLNQSSVFPLLRRVPRPVVSYMKSGCLQFEAAMILNDLGIDERFRPKRTCTESILAFEAAWARRQTDSPGEPRSQEDRDLERALKGWLRFHDAVLVGELVPLTLQYLQQNPAARELTAFDHVLVDEYQDLNRAEQELLDKLAAESAEAVVGDANQSIYSFRYANPEAIDQFDCRHPETHDEKLAECRRCPTRVVAMANRLMEANPKSEATRLQPRADNPEGEVHVIQWASSEEETVGVAAYVEHLVESKRFPPEEIMILCPRREIGYRIRDHLVDAAVPAHSFFHEEALDSGAAQRGFALLTLLNDEEDRVALRWWLGQKSATGRRGAYARLREHCEATGAHPRDALAAVHRGELAIPYAGNLLPPYEELIGLLEKLRCSPLSDIVDELFPEGDETVSPLRGVASLGLQKCRDVADLFDYVRHYITQPEVPRGEFVRVMSLHKSKGLTSKAVVVVGCCQGLIPTRSRKLQKLRFANREQELQEQRRLF